MTLIEHLNELRARLIKSAVAVALGAVVVWFLYPAILDELKVLLCGAIDELGGEQECRLVINDPLQGFSTRLTISGYGGLALAMPVVLWQLWRFIVPGLYRSERRLAIAFVFSGVVLFFAGAWVAYWSLPRALVFLFEIGGDVDPLLTPGSYIGLVVKMIIAFGIGFEFPIVLVFLQLAGVVSPDKLASMRRFAILFIVVFAAVITPTGDPFTLGVLSVPLYVFYEISILIGRLARRRRRRREVVSSERAS
jgi:sec-independent protein translocase protein TatC